MTDETKAPAESPPHDLQAHGGEALSRTGYVGGCPRCELLQEGVRQLDDPSLLPELNRLRNEVTDLRSIALERANEIERLRAEDQRMVARLHRQSNIMAEKDSEIARLQSRN